MHPDLELALELADIADGISAARFRATDLVVDTKPDKTWVTEADKAVEAALERIGRRCLTHLLSNEQAALAGEPEGIHQMRVAVRRLRSALSALKRPLQKKHYRWASEELRWLAHTLAPVRNLDIFAACLVHPVTHA